MSFRTASRRCTSSKDCSTTYRLQATAASEQLNFKDVLRYVTDADRSKFVCANEQFSLLGTTHVTWPAANCSHFLHIVNTYNDAS